MTTVPLVPYTRLPNDADFAMVYPSGQEIIEINVTRFDAGYSRYDSHTQTLVQNPPYYSEVFRLHGHDADSHVNEHDTCTVFDQSLYDNAVYMTTNATNPGLLGHVSLRRTLTCSGTGCHDKGYTLFYSEANATVDRHPTI